MLSAVRHFLLLICLAAALAATAAIPAESRISSPQQNPEQAPPAPQTVRAPQAAPAPPAPSPQVPAGPVIVLDPAHGGTDTGARGPDGVVEKDLVLQIVRTMRAELEQRGYRVITTRNDDSNPSYDDRAGIANAYPGAVFVSVHISSTGTPGTVRAYYDRFETPVAPAPGSAGLAGVAAQTVNRPSGGLIDWNEAQRPFVDASRRLANLIQVQLTQLFHGSPLVSTGAAIRGLRSINDPAVAIEISSVSGSSPNALAAAATPLARAVAASVIAFRQGSAIGAR
ncbi:MAG TPA: N-acetylmuramoyl-L-alanine amidase [Candidatus Acidoferrales bacterium]